jgi:hypothetical protein
MPQIALNIDELTLNRMERVAEQRQTTVSDWIENTIRNVLQNNNRSEFLDFFGAIQDDTFDIPDEIDSKTEY